MTRKRWLCPAGFFRNIYNPTLDCGFETEPIEGLGGGSIPWPRGRVLGGSSASNGLIYIRGQKEDFDLWRQMGNPGWSYEDVLPCYQLSNARDSLSPHCRYSPLPLGRAPIALARWGPGEGSGVREPRERVARGPQRTRPGPHRTRAMGARRWEPAVGCPMRRVREPVSPIHDSGYYVAGEAMPGPEVESDADWLRYIREKAGTGFHASGSCRMGTDPMAVVDPTLRVSGVGGLRVVDASVMPTVVSGNTNAATIMIAEKAADMILGGGAAKADAAASRAGP